jgi:large subunit ribosomal protein L10
MSKPVKEMVMADYKRRFENLDGALVIDIRGIEANQNNELRLSLAEKNIRVTVIKNALARKALQGTGLENATNALRGPSALAYGGSSVVDVARELVDWAKKVEKLDLKGAVLDGEYFDGAEGVKRLSAYPTKEEAQATIVQLVLTPGAELAGAVAGPGGQLLAVVDALIDKLEKGAPIAKVG